MNLVTGLSKFIVKGTKAAAANTAIKRELVNRGILQNRWNKCEIRNGIAILKHDWITNTNVKMKERIFLGLDEKGKFVTLKTKTMQNWSDKRFNEAHHSVENVYHELCLKTVRSADSKNGLINLGKYKEKLPSSSCLTGIFDHGHTGVIQNGYKNTFLRSIEDTTGKRGAAFKYMNGGSGSVIKGYYNPNLGSGYVTGLVGKTKSEFISKEQYEALLHKLHSTTA